MFYSQCGAKIPDSSNYCKICGIKTEISNTASEIQDEKANVENFKKAISL